VKKAVYDKLPEKTASELKSQNENIKKRIPLYKKHPDAPVRPPLAIVLFCQETGARTSHSWRDLPVEEKAKYIDKANEHKKAYIENMIEFIKKLEQI